MLNDKEKEIQDAEEKLEDAKKKYEEGLKNYQLYKEKTLDIEDFGSSVIIRKYNSSLYICEELSGSFYRMCFSMASLFVAVGLLVCYSVLSRIVSDQTILIGTKKAMGMSDRTIKKYYLSYTLVALIIGCLLGGLFGYFVVEKVLLNSVASNFYCRFDIQFSIYEYLSICLLNILLLLLTTYFACNKVLKKNAVELLASEDYKNYKKHFYERFKLWDKLSLLSKTIVNNFFNDKQRVFGTIVGIAGSVALVVTAFTLNNNVVDSYPIMFDKYYHFDTIVFYDSENKNAKNNLENFFNKNNIPNTNIFFTRIYNMTPNSDYTMAYLFVPENNDFDGLVTIESIKDDHKNTQEGYWMCLGYDNAFHPNDDDPVTIINYNGLKKQIVPNGYFTHHLINYQNIMDKETYEENFKEEVSYNAFLVNTNNSFKSYEQELKKVDGYVTNIDYYNITYESFEAFSNISKAVVSVYIVLAIAMYFLVVLTLLKMHISERKKELIVLMINGYSIKKAKKYIYSDTIFLSIIGIVIGLFVGVIMGIASEKSFETSVTVFLHRLDIKACLLGILISTVMIIIVSIISLRSIDDLSIADINEL